MAIKIHRPVIGVLAAAGQATRIAPLPCSKEILPIGFQPADAAGRTQSKVVCHYLLEHMRRAGAERAFIVLRARKWDIPAYLGDGTSLNMNLAYLLMRLPYGAPYTLDQAYPFVQDALIVFGFPDILFQPDDAFVQLLAQQQATDADLVLGLFPTDQPHAADMVELDQSGAVRNIVIKSPDTRLAYAWIIAVWTPTFTQFMHEHLAADEQARAHSTEPHSELYMGHIIQAALGAGLKIEVVTFPSGSFLDIGTPDNLGRVLRDGVARVLHG